MKKAFKYLGLLVLLMILYVASVLIYGTLNDWQPEPILSEKIEQNAKELIIKDSLLSFVVWNVGYGGLPSGADFFFDAGGFYTDEGKMVRPPEEMVEAAVKGAEAFVKNTKADFFLMQEVDFNSKRSYYNQQFDLQIATKPEYSAVRSRNYLVDWVPLPITAPWNAYGHVDAGLATYAKYQPSENTRIALPGKFDWPTNIFQLDRCVLSQKYPTAFGKDLVVFNVHLSAYDKGGVMKKEQMVFLKELCLAEYEKGNYVIVGGDWNQCPPNFQFDSFMPGATQGYTQTNISNDYYPADWIWAYDATTPTNRKVSTKYEKGVTFETLIDFYLVSPNVKVNLVKGIPQDFKFSDHQPIYLEIELLK